MNNKTKINKRRLNSSILTQLENSVACVSNSYELVKLQARHKCFGVLRTKGGSGEQHTVKKLVEDLLSQNKNVLVCFENPIDQDHYYTQYFPEDTNIFLKTHVLIKAGATGLFNCNWTNQYDFTELIKALNDAPCDYSVIFTCGTSSGGALAERVSAVIEDCESIFVSVNSSDVNSIEPAKKLASINELNLGKINVAWWYEPNRYEYRLNIIPLINLKKESVENNNLLADDINNLSMI